MVAVLLTFRARSIAWDAYAFVVATATRLALVHAGTAVGDQVRCTTGVIVVAVTSH